eukprot:7268352-Ditylum_brightwellii.AAC.1
MMLFSMMSLSALNKATRGTWLAGAVLMFVYIDLASAVMILHPGGMVILFVINSNAKWMEKAAAVGDDGSREHWSFMDLGH